MPNRNTGASLTEFIVAAPIVMLIGMATVQAALIYHGKTTLNYATFEAARTGAVNHAQVNLMRRELGQRLAPVQGGDGSLGKAAIAVATSVLEAERADITQLEILNPTLEAFDDWGVHSPSTHQRVIPNVHLRHKGHEIGQASGLSLRDANLLKLKVTYGLELKVPVVGSLFAMAMMKIDTDNTHLYARKKFPLTSVATVRMQSEAWEQEIKVAGVSFQPPVDFDTGQGGEAGGSLGGQQPIGENRPDSDEPETNEPSAEEPATDVPLGHDPAATDPETEPPNSECEGGEYGLGNISELINTSDYENQQCPVENPAFSAPTAGGAGTNSDNSPCE